MTILDYRTICAFRNAQDNNKGLLVFYKKADDTFELLHNFEGELQGKLIKHLKDTNAGDKTGETRIYIADDTEYKYIALSCISKPKKQETKIDVCRKATSSGVKFLKTYSVYNIVISTSYMPQETSFAAVLCLYDYTILKKTKQKNIKISGDVKCEEFEKGIIFGEFSNYSRFLADTPANLMTPTLFVEYAKDMLKECTNDDTNTCVNVYEKEYMEEKKMNLFLSVSEGSEQPMKFLVINYKNNESEKVDLSLVGKGITFDSGGISLKGSKGMGDMKADMMGGAAVLTATCLAIKLREKINLTVSIPLCENLPSGKATKPGDVKVGMSGISVEIDNTDAEGRLILGDALTHAQMEKPRYLIDVATLTGAMAVSLGSIYTGYFCNDEKFSDVIYNAGQSCRDIAWRMPLHYRYKELIESQVADIINVGGPYGGSCTAASFLEEFIEKEQKWAHFDVAGVMKSCEKEIYGKGMSGKPVKLLYEIIETISNENK
ncbi:hypothetical protein BDAP_002344 [Binucleata daphniae]